MRSFHLRSGLLALFSLACCLPLPWVSAGEIARSRLGEQEIWTLSQGATRVRVAPGAGANVFSIEIDGVEYLHQPESPDNLKGVRCGVPILYPTPNRVRGGKFTFEGQTVAFPTNGSGNHIHGLVNNLPWQVLGQESTADDARLVCGLDFSANEQLAGLFPFPHQLRLTIRVSSNAVRWTYEVDNTRGSKKVPFGFALHPYFRYQGARAQTYLTIPATHWMEANERLPTGRLIPAADLEYPLGKPLCLKDTQLDDVFWGLSSERPTRIDFRDVQRQVVIVASEQFTHLVVWTPDRPFFGVESQTCSTDAHNLYSAGQQAAAHLQICPPGETMSGWVEYQFPASP